MCINIISHNCVGGRIYQQKKIPYGNPFMWCVIPPDDFYYLYTHYGDLNYHNIAVDRDGNWCKIVIDDKVSVYYVHYKYDERSSTPIKKSQIDIFYNKIEEYAVEKYLSRLERMKGSPLFIVTDRKFQTKHGCDFKKEDLEKYVGKDNCIVVTCDGTINGNNVIHVKSDKIDPEEIARIIIKELAL